MRISLWGRNILMWLETKCAPSPPLVICASGKANRAWIHPRADDKFNSKFGPLESFFGGHDIQFFKLVHSFIWNSKQPEGSAAKGKKKENHQSTDGRRCECDCMPSNSHHTQWRRGGERHPYPGIKAARRESRRSYRGKVFTWSRLPSDARASEGMHSYPSVCPEF